MLEPFRMIAVDLVVAALFVAGLAGAVLPFLPGPLLIFVGAFVYITDASDRARVARDIRAIFGTMGR